VRRAIAQLRAEPIHQFFPAYLHLRQQSALQGTEEAIKPEWKKELGPFLEVAGAPAKKPYFRPFTAGGEGEGEWLNENLAGSYAPASLRERPRRVVDVTSSGHFGLKDKHWELARTYLLNEVQMPLWALAAFMLRDYALEDYDTRPGYPELEAAFVEMFGYDSPGGQNEVDYLYDRTPGHDIDVWFEELKSDE
jgi:hypothetical protein